MILMIITEVLLLLLGFAILSLSISRHYSHVTNITQRLPKRALWLFKSVGYVLLTSALVLAVMTWGTALGSVYWFATAMFVSLIVSFTLTFKPLWLSFIAVIFSPLINKA